MKPFPSVIEESIIEGADTNDSVFESSKMEDEGLTFDADSVLKNSSPSPIEFLSSCTCVWHYAKVFLKEDFDSDFQRVEVFLLDASQIFLVNSGEAHGLETNHISFDVVLSAIDSNEPFRMSLRRLILMQEKGL